ncbi:MAG: membrane protein insertion efficiency factor YidD [Microgenomates group bacterium]
MNYHKILAYSKVAAANLGLSHGRCRYSPTCSLYTKQAIAKHGILYGAWLSAKRLLKCHPWSAGGFDPVP